MKISTWPIRFIGMLLLIFVYNLSKAQGDAAEINVAPNINTKLVPVPLSDKINSESMEIGPLISASGKRLYYSRYGHPKNTGGPEDIDIWYNNFNDSTHSWGEAVNIGPPLNNAGPNFVFEVGWTDDSLLVANRYDKKGNMKAGLSFSVWDGRAWSIPKPIHVKNDYNLAENVGYDLSPFRNVLLIAEEKVDSYGKSDLYVSFRDRSAPQTVTESFNMGPVINSTGSERSPFLTDDTHTLYFASDGHKGFGKLDIFRSRRLDDTWTNWSKPENLGPAINTPFDDRNLIFTATSRYAFFSRGINDTRTDIYSFPLSELFVPITTLGEQVVKSTTPEPGQTFNLINAFPENRAELTDSAKSDLNKLVVYMVTFKNLGVFLSTHSSPHTYRSESLALSDQRLEQTKQYLISKGIDKKRIQGESDGHDVVNVDPRKFLANSVEVKFINKVVVATGPKGRK